MFLKKKIEKDTLAQVFSCEFCKISKSTFFTENIWVTASGKYSFLHRLLHKTLSRLLKEHAVSTLFSHNNDRQTQKCKSSVMIEEGKAKHQHC